VHRKCGGDRAPDALKSRVRHRITEMVVTETSTTIEITSD